MSRMLLLATVALMGAATLPTYAAQIVTFGQTSSSNTVQATVNGADTQTTLSITNAVVDLTQFINGPLNGLDFNLTATSTDSAVPIGTSVLQHFNGTFCISTGTNCSGTDILSGSFTDAAFGVGDQLSVNVGAPPDTLSLHSDVVSSALLQEPSALTLAFTAVTPAVHILGTTIAPFTASFSGDVSASAATVPEPASLAVLGLGMIGLGLVRRKA